MKYIWEMSDINNGIIIESIASWQKYIIGYCFSDETGKLRLSTINGDGLILEPMTKEEICDFLNKGNYRICSLKGGE